MGKFPYEIELIGSPQDHDSVAGAVRKLLEENDYPPAVALSGDVLHYISNNPLEPLFLKIRGIPGVRNVKASDL